MRSLNTWVKRQETEPRPRESQLTIAQKMVWNSETYVEKHTWGNPPKNLFWSNNHLPQRMVWNWETYVQKDGWGNPPKNLFWSTSHWPQKTPEDKHVSFLWGTWETNVNKSWGDLKCKQQWREPEKNNYKKSERIAKRFHKNSWTLHLLWAIPQFIPWMVPCPPN